MVAGAGPRLLDVTARFADIINFAPRPPGQRFADLEFATFGIRQVVTDAIDLSGIMVAFAAEYNTSPEVRGDPGFGTRIERCDVGRRQVQSHCVVEVGRRLVGRKAQVGGTQLDQLAAQTGERQWRMGAADDD